MKQDKVVDKADRKAAKIEKTAAQVAKIEAEIAAGDTSPEKAQDLLDQKAKLDRLNAGDDDEPVVS